MVWGPNTIRVDPDNMEEDLSDIGVATNMVRGALLNLGFDSKHDPSTERTPERWVKYILEFMQPYDLDEVLGPRFSAVHDNTSIHGMIIQEDIPYTAICEHHLLPFQGFAYVGYIPDTKILGLSKFTRLVHAVSHEKPGLQEGHTEKIADIIFNNIPAKGAIVVIKARHGCMGCRGVNAPGVTTTTSCIRGLFRDVQAAREEFLSLSGLRK